MLIDFTVENYRSIKEPVTLSAIAQPGRATPRSGDGARRRRVKADDEIAPAFAVEGRDFELLPALGVFGANASGKSNVIDALDHFLFFITYGVTDQDEGLQRFVPFLLDADTATAPSRFRLRVALEQVIYTYALCLDQKRIVSETLQQSLPHPRRTGLVYERRWDESTQQLTWKREPRFAWSRAEARQKVSSQQSFMSYLVNGEQPEEINALWQWLMHRWPGTVLRGRDLDEALIGEVKKRDPRMVMRAANLLRLLDTGVTDMRMVHPDDEFWVTHRTKTGDVNWPLREESLGTQSLVGLIFRIINALDTNTPVLVDELGSNVHPNITSDIVRLFQSRKTNPKRAQLLFTSHDNTLLSGSLLRRDQVWFTQKRLDGSTELYPLTAFRPRNDLALDRAYLDGRLEAVPILPRTEDLLEGVMPEAVA